MKKVRQIFFKYFMTVVGPAIYFFFFLAMTIFNYKYVLKNVLFSLFVFFFKSYTKKKRLYFRLIFSLPFVNSIIKTSVFKKKLIAIEEIKNFIHYIFWKRRRRILWTYLAKEKIYFLASHYTILFPSSKVNVAIVKAVKKKS